jgi:hypothetical protein
MTCPKLETVFVMDDIGPSNYIKTFLENLVFGSGVRPSVQRLFINLNLLSLGSNEPNQLSSSLTKNFSNLTYLRLQFGIEDAGLFRSLLQRLPTSCTNIQFRSIKTKFIIYDEDFLGLDREMMNSSTTPPLLQFPGKTLQSFFDKIYSIKLVLKPHI